VGQLFVFFDVCLKILVGLLNGDHSHNLFGVNVVALAHAEMIGPRMNGL
jgi:hypothetical protein